MNIATLELTFGELSALLTALATVGGAILWWLSQFFIRKSQYWAKRREDEESLTKRLGTLEEKIVGAIAVVAKEAKDASEAAAVSIQKHELLKQPFQALELTLREVKDSIEKSSARADERDRAFQAREEKFLEALSAIDKRVAVIEATAGKRRSRQ